MSGNADHIVHNGMAAYLRRRNIPDCVAVTICGIANRDNGWRGPFESNGFLYAIDHVLDSSGRAGFDIELVNRSLGIDNGPYIAIALAEGDDPICLDLESGRVILWLVEDGEQIVLSRTFVEFTSMIASITD